MILHASPTEAFISTYASDSFEKRVCMGLYSRCPDYIDCMFTHGLDGVNMKRDVNKFVRLLAADIEAGRI